MCRLFSKIPKGLDLVSNMLKERVENEGLTMIKQVEDGGSNKMDFVEGLTKLHDKYFPRVIVCFPNHTLFEKAFEEAFTFVCNKSVAGCSFVELLATLCDDILKRGGTEKVDDVAIEETQEKVAKLVALRSDKQLFAELYRKKLAGRLLFDKSANTVHEESMLTKLKQQCNRGFTHKMEGMVKDMTLAKETQSGFEKYLENNLSVNPDIALTVTVLTSGFWPSYNSININLPNEMRQCVEVFREFYQRTTKKRNLTWINSLGTCEILGNFEPKTIELIVTTCQASVLLLFNSCDRLSYQDIVSRLNISDDDVVPLLHSLSCANYKILTKEPNTETISSTDNFVFNSNFTDNSRKIMIPLPRVDEKKKVTEDVVKKRTFAIDASICRIMKRLKILDYQQLTVECVQEMRAEHKPDKTEIKQRIESLIGREYLERDTDNAELLRYLP